MTDHQSFLISPLDTGLGDWTGFKRKKRKEKKKSQRDVAPQCSLSGVLWQYHTHVSTLNDTAWVWGTPLWSLWPRLLVAASVEGEDPSRLPIQRLTHLLLASCVLCHTRARALFLPSQLMVTAWIPKCLQGRGLFLLSLLSSATWILRRILRSPPGGLCLPQWTETSGMLEAEGFPCHPCPTPLHQASGVPGLLRCWSCSISDYMSVSGMLECKTTCVQKCLQDWSLPQHSEVMIYYVCQAGEVHLPEECAPFK